MGDYGGVKRTMEEWAGLWGAGRIMESEKSHGVVWRITGSGKDHGIYRGPWGAGRITKVWNGSRDLGRTVGSREDHGSVTRIMDLCGEDHGEGLCGGSWESP